MTMTDETTTALVADEINPEIVAKLESRKIVDLDQLVEALAPPPEVVKVGLVPMPVAITDDESTALAILPAVYGSVVPTERRELEPAEFTKLIGERTTLNAVKKMVQRRLDDIALTVNNHNTEDAEKNGYDPESVILGPDGKPWYTEKGHIVRKAQFRGDDPKLGTLFSVETRKGTPSISEAKLKAISEDPDKPGFTHADYLRMTSQVRVFDANKAMLLLRKNPRLLPFFRDAMSTTAPGVSVYERANK